MRRVCPHVALMERDRNAALTSVKERSRSFLAVLAITVSLIQMPRAAQAAQAAARSHVDGTVTEQSGGVIVGATVTLAPRDGSPKTTTTDRQGSFRFERIAAGPYTLTVEAAGFLGHRSAIDLLP